MKSPSSDKQSMKRGLWSEEEDAKIVDYVSKHGIGKWTSVPKKTGLRRCGKSCRLRWNNYLRPDIKHESFTPKEEELIIKLHAAIGSRWSIIAQQLPGRTDNDVKNYWNTKLKKRLADMGIDPVTHKPFSQIFADYGNIGGASKPGTRVLSFNKDLKNVMVTNKIDTSPISPFSMQISMPMPISGHAIVSSKSEPILDNFVSRNTYMSNNNNSLNLLTELQAINLVKVNHDSSSSSLPNFRVVDQGTGYSLSSSTCSSAAKDLVPIGFDWNEFLIDDDEFLPSEAQVENEDNLQKVEGLDSKDVEEDHTISSNELNETASCESSFVEALLVKESEMLMEFPDLMGQEFY